MFWYYYLNPILIAAAVIPAVALLVKVYRADRLERESRAMLLSLVIGGVIATALAKVTERAGDFLLDAVRELLPKYLMYPVLPMPEIALAQLGNDAGIIGAALLGR